MATAAAHWDGRSVSIGRVFSRAFGTIRSHPVATLGISFLFGALPWLPFTYGLQPLWVESFSSPGGVAMIAIFSGFVAILLAMLTQGALVRATVACSEGRKASFGESAMAGLCAAPPLFLLGLGSALGIATGLVVLIVPGVMLYLMWSVAAPALVEERLGPTGALGRSNDLTDGARWKIFAISLFILALYLLISALIPMLNVWWYGEVLVLTASDIPWIQLRNLLIDLVAKTVVSAVWGVVQTSLYVELRDRKDGPRSEKLAEIFG